MWIIFKVVGIISAIATAVALNWETVKSVMVAVGEWLWSKFGGILTVIGMMLLGVALFLYEGVIKPLWDFFKTFLLPVLLVAGGVIGTIVGFLLAGLDMLWGLVQTIFLAIEALFRWDWDYFKENFDRIWGQIFEEVGALADFFLDEMWTAIAELASKLFNWSWGGGSGETFNAAGGVNTPPTSALATDMTASGFRTVTGATVSYASGITQLPRDGLYYGHEGEEIVQRGGRSNNGAEGTTIGTINFYSYGKEEPESFARRAYNEFQRMMNADREAVQSV